MTQQPLSVATGLVPGRAASCRADAHLAQVRDSPGCAAPSDLCSRAGGPPKGWTRGLAWKTEGLPVRGDVYPAYHRRGVRLRARGGVFGGARSIAALVPTNAADSPNDRCSAPEGS